jgi:hypothetical protein
VTSIVTRPATQGMQLSMQLGGTTDAAIIIFDYDVKAPPALQVPVTPHRGAPARITDMSEHHEGKRRYCAWEYEQMHILQWSPFAQCAKGPLLWKALLLWYVHMACPSRWCPARW